MREVAALGQLAVARLVEMAAPRGLIFHVDTLGGTFISA